MKNVTLIFTMLVSFSMLGYAKSDDHFYLSLKDNFKNGKVVKNKSFQSTSKSTLINEYTVILEDNIATISIGYWGILFMQTTDGLFFHKDLFDKYSANQFVKFDDNIFFKINNGEIDFKQLFFIISDESKKDSKKEEVVWIDMAKASKVFLKQILDVFEKNYSLKFDLEKIYSFKEGKNKSGNIDNTLSEKLKKSFFSKFKLAQNSNIKIDDLLLQVQKSYTINRIEKNTLLLKNDKDKSEVLIYLYTEMEDFYEYNKLSFYFFSTYFTLQKYIKRTLNKTPYFCELLKHYDMQGNSDSPNVLELRKDVIYLPIGKGIIKLQNVNMTEKEFIKLVNIFFAEKSNGDYTYSEIFSNDEFDFLAAIIPFTSNFFPEKIQKKNENIVTRKITNADIVSIVEKLNKKYNLSLNSRDYIYKLKIHFPFSKYERDFYNDKIIFGKELYEKKNSYMSILIWQLNDAKYNYDYFAIQYFLRAFLYPLSMESYFFSIQQIKNHSFKVRQSLDPQENPSEVFMIYGNIGISVKGEKLLEKEKILADIAECLNLKEK